MNKPCYNIFSPEKNFYSFISEGKNGQVLKAVVFAEIEPLIYNLALLDYNHENDEWSDSVSTNNGDIVKIMATVVAIIDEFLELNKNVQVHFEGNTNTRNNLYNRIIKNNFEHLSELYKIIAKEDEFSKPEEYNLGKKYKAFYICKK